jgi:hypothetical protein
MKKTGRIRNATIKYINRKRLRSIEEPPISHFDKSMNKMEKKDESNLARHGNIYQKHLKKLTRKWKR